MPLGKAYIDWFLIERKKQPIDHFVESILLAMAMILYGGAVLDAQQGVHGAMVGIFEISVHYLVFEMALNLLRDKPWFYLGVTAMLDRAARSVPVVILVLKGAGAGRGGGINHLPYKRMTNIVDIARLDLGKKEKPGNSGFESPELEKRLRAVGWQPGWAWCASATEAWAWAAFPELKSKIQGLFVPSAVATHRNLVRAGYKSTMKPEVGAFVYWQHMKDGKAEWQGHTGVVSKVVSDTEFYSIEGNTNSDGSREGDSVQEKHRFIKHVDSGLQVIGFIKLA